jgi:GMP synthase (glutamine-hydrolysing)
VAGPRLLVLDAYAPEGRAALREAGGTEAGALYARMLARLEPEARVEIAWPADPDPDLPAGADLAGYDGIAWTGSSLTIHHADDLRVARQIELAGAAYRAGVPSFGSCWAAQLAVAAAGGRCARSPRGREFGVARGIRLSDEGRAHPLFAGKTEPFDAFTSHEDEVVGPGSGAAVLAGNDWSRVQAVDVARGAGRFWAVQYHPEYDWHEVASLARLRRDELVAQGTWPSARDADAWIERAEALHASPDDAELAAALGAGPDLLDPAVRTREAANWLAALRAGALRAKRPDDADAARATRAPGVGAG